MKMKLVVLAALLGLAIVPARADYVILDGNKNPKTIKAGTLSGPIVLNYQTPVDPAGIPFGLTNPVSIQFGNGVVLPSFASTQTFNLGNINGAVPSLTNPLFVAPATGASFNVVCTSGCAGGGGGLSVPFGGPIGANGTPGGFKDSLGQLQPLLGDVTNGQWVSIKASVSIPVTGTFWPYTLGQQVSGSSVPVVLPAAQITALTPPASVGITGTLPAFAATPTFNLGTLNGAATAANQTNATQKTQIVDGTGNVIASTSNNLNVQCANCSGSGVSTADKASFTAGTSLFAGAGGFFQTTPTLNPLTTGQQGMFQVTAQRALFSNLRDSSGTELGVGAAPLQVSLANTGANATALLVTGGGGTFPVTQASAAALNATVVNAGTFAVQAAPSSAATWGINTLGSATAGQSGELALGAVTTAAPSYTTAQTNALSLTLAGALRVDGSGVTQPVSLASTTITGTVAVTQSGAWSLSANQSVNVSQINGVAPLMGNGVTGTGSQRVTIASDNTAFTVNPASATAPVSTMNSANAAAGVTAAAALVFDDVAPTAITENNFGYARMSANRNQYQTIRDAAGNERGVNVTASNALSSDLTSIAGVAPLTGNGVSGTGALRVAIASDNTAFSVNAAVTQATSSNLKAQVDPLTPASWGIATATQNSASATNGQLALGQFNASPTTITTGNMSPFQMDSSANLLVNCKSGCTGASDTTAVLSGMTSLNAATQIALVGTQSTSVLLSGTWVGTLTPEVSADGGTTWVASQFYNVNTHTAAATVSANGTYDIVGTGGKSHARVRLSLFTSGTVTGNLKATSQAPSANDAEIAINTTAGGPIAAGTNIVGKFGIDQTTPGTTNGVQVNAALPAGSNVIGALTANQSVNIAQVAGVATPVGSGVQATAPRMTLATDSPGIVTLGQTTKSASVPVVLASDQVGTAGTANANVLTVQGIASMTPINNNVAQINSVNTLAGSGAVGAGAQRIAVGTDTATIAGSAPGTAGAASASVLSVQGVASMVPVVANPTNGYPNGAIAETISNTGTTAATTATLAAAVGKTTYICGFSMRSVATAAAAGNATVTGTITGTLNFTHGTGVTPSVVPNDQRFNPCIPASTTNTTISVVSPAAGTGGVMSVTAWGFQL